jgi:23S rRNA (guanine745-N1)-methyltransferase
VRGCGHARCRTRGASTSDEAISRPALAAALPALRCPVCAGTLALDRRELRCGRGHSFDIARQGYVNLAVGGPAAGRGDTTAMIAARSQFLSQGHYAPIAAALGALAARHAGGGGPEVVVDLAGGTGYYLAAVLGALPGRTGICLDRSRPALRRAAAAHPRAAAVGADVWRPLPLASGSAALVLSVFGPRNAAETIRILAPGGVFLLVTPTAAHLSEIIAPLGMLTVDAAKQQRLAVSMTGLAAVTDEPLRYQVALPHAALSDLVAMGPSAHHVDAGERARRIAALPDPVPVTVSVTLSAFRPAG